MACNHICHVCGALENGHYNTWAEEDFRKNQCCQKCNFWFSKIANYGVGFDKHFVDGDWNMYLCRDSKEARDGGPVMRGFGGRMVRVNFSDGTYVISTNMWTQGTVPEDWRTKFPINAQVTWLDTRPWAELDLIKQGYWK